MDETAIAVAVREVNKTLKTLAPVGSGTVTDVSVVTANGVSGSVATSTTTPAITLSLGAITPSTVTIGAGAAITSSGAGGALGTAAFTAATAYQAVDADLTSWAGVTRAANFDTFVATPSSANLATLISDETGTAGNVVFSGSPTLTTPKIAKIVAPADSTTAVQITKADGTSAVGTWDTTNSIFSVTGKLSAGTSATGAANGEITSAISTTSGSLYLGSDGVKWIGRSGNNLTISGFNQITQSPNLILSGAASISGTNGNMTITAGTGASRTMALQTTSGASAAQTVVTLGADKSSTFAGPVILPAGTTAAGTAPLKFTTQASPLTTVEQGTMELVGNSLQFTQKAKRRGVGMTQSTITADTTWAALANGTTESGAIITAEHGANYLEVGKMEEIILIGTLAQRSNPTAILTTRVKYAGSTVLTFATPGSTPIAANSALLIRVYTTCRTTGNPGTMQINAVMEVNGTATDPQAAALSNIDTTTAQNTTITFQWGADNDAANTVTINQGRVLCIEPNR